MVCSSKNTKEGFFTYSVLICHFFLFLFFLKWWMLDKFDNFSPYFFICNCDTKDTKKSCIMNISRFFSEMGMDRYSSIIIDLYFWKSIFGQRINFNLYSVMCKKNYSYASPFFFTLHDLSKVSYLRLLQGTLRLFSW